MPISGTLAQHGSMTPLSPVSSLSRSVTNMSSSLSSGTDYQSGLEGKQSNESVLSTVTFLPYKNSTYGVQIIYPSGWKILLDDEFYDGIIDVTEFVSYREDRLDNYTERLTVSIDTLPDKNMTLVDYFKRITAYMSDTFRDPENVDYDLDGILLAGYPAYRLISTHSLDGVNIKQMEIGSKVGDKIYYVVYSAEVNRYANFLPVIQEMINSLVIENN